jgi:hypothetical protein
METPVPAATAIATAIARRRPLMARGRVDMRAALSKGRANGFVRGVTANEGRSCVLDVSDLAATAA